MVSTILFILAILSFLFVVFGVTIGSVALVPLGLALFAAAELFAHWRGVGPTL